MSKTAKIAIIGGDARQCALALYLARQKQIVTVCGFDVAQDEGISLGESAATASAGAGVVLLPLPAICENDVVCKSGGVPLSAVVSAAPGALYLGGMVTEAGRLKEQYGINISDYYCGKLKELNAIPTAEGAIAIAMAHRDRTINGSRAIVTGYGMVAKRLAATAKALGAEVIVAARRTSARREAQNEGFRAIAIEQIKEELGGCDIIFNTVPAVIFADQEIEKMRADAIYIELASKPYGICFEAARAHGKKILPAPSLPGKVAPVTAGEAIGEVVMRILTSEGILD